MAKLDEEDTKRRKRLLKKSEQEIAVLLTNPDGLRRLVAISDEEWQAAVEAEGERAP